MDVLCQVYQCYVKLLLLKWFPFIFQAVKHLHDNNLVHMDIKPDNIFISYDGICKLGDFGLVIDMSKVCTGKFCCIN